LLLPRQHQTHQQAAADQQFAGARTKSHVRLLRENCCAAAAAAMFEPTWSTISPYDKSPVSGAPRRAAEVQKPLMNAKSKPVQAAQQQRTQHHQHLSMQHIELLAKPQ
jgi:hypothetical protein